MKAIKERKSLTWNRKIVLVFLCVLTVLRMLLFIRTPLVGAAGTGDDDWNLVNQAWNLMQGHWLGNGIPQALSYGISFPVFLAFCNWLSIPYMLAAGLLYIGSVLYFLHTWRDFFCCDWTRILLYLILLYAPVMMTVYTAQRVWDLSLVPALLLLLFSLGYRMFQKKDEKLLPWTLLFGAVLSFFWYLRNANLWLLPLLLGFLIFTGYRLIRMGCAKKVPLLLIPVAMPAVLGLAIALLHAHYEGTFAVYEDTQPSHSASTPVEIAKDTLLTVFHMASNQMTDVDMYPSSGSEENLRLLESMTGSCVLYPSNNPLRLTGWVFPTNDSSNLELAVTDSAGTVLTFAKFENSEDVYLANMDYAASRVCRFFLEAPAVSPEDAFVTIYINGKPKASYPAKPIAIEEDGFHLFIETSEFYTDPAQKALLAPVRISKGFLLLNRILGILVALAAVISYVGMPVLARSLKSKERRQMASFWLIMTTVGFTALLGILYCCIRYPSAAGFDPAAYASGPWMLLQIFLLGCAGSVIPRVIGQRIK